ncbi:hypothetical protein N9H80_01755 [Candidatus Pseudothioglobus singularis]|nr:hypothetical protein [Candidatus Pseudothioglobus singularis]
MISPSYAGIEECEKAYASENYKLAYVECSKTNLNSNLRVRFLLALIFELGEVGTSNDESIAVGEFLALARLNYCDAYPKLALWYKNQNKPDTNPWKKTENNNQAKAWEDKYIPCKREQGINEFENKEYDKAIINLKLVARNDSEVQLYLGLAYAELNDIDSARSWLNKSNNNGNKKALNELNKLKDNSRNTSPIKDKEDSDNVDSKAETDSEINVYRLSDCSNSYNQRRFKEAIKACTYNAELGEKTAQYYLGMMYREGYGGIKDTQKAVKWLELAANQNLYEAAYELGYLYYSRSSEKLFSYHKAREWFLKAAQNGNDKAQYKLGVMFNYGYGTVVNLTHAIYWLTRSADQGNNRAKNLLVSITPDKPNSEPNPNPPGQADPPSTKIYVPWWLQIGLPVLFLLFIKRLLNKRKKKKEKRTRDKIKALNEDYESKLEIGRQLKLQEKKEAKAKREAVAKAKRIAEAKAELEAEVSAQREAEARRKEKEKREAEAKAKRDRKAKLIAEAKKKAEAEAKKKAEAEAKKKAEAKSKRKIESITKRIADAKADRDKKQESSDKKLKDNKQVIKPKFKEATNKRFKIVKLEHGSDKWIKWRKKGINSVDGEEIFKTSMCTKNFSKEVDIESNLLQQARVEYEKNYSISIFPVNIEDRRFPWLQASIDGFSEDFSKLVKISTSTQEYNDSKNNIYPKEQLQHLMMITGLEQIDYWCYSKNKDSNLLVVRRDQKMINQIYHRYIKSQFV